MPRKKKKIKLINFFIKKEEFRKADREIKHYIKNFNTTEEIIWAKIKLLQSQKETKNANYRTEIIKTAFLLRTFFRTNQKEINLLLGETYYDKGENYFVQSKYYLEKYVENNHSENLSSKIGDLLYEINLKLGFIEEAYFYADRLSKSHPDNLDLKVKLIELLLLKKENFEAQKKLEEIIINQPYSPFTLKTSKMLLDILHQFDSYQKMNFYNDYITVKFKGEGEFMRNYQEYYQKLTLKKE